LTISEEKSFENKALWR